MAKKMATKVLCCLVVIVILMMPVSVFAINGDNKSTGNTLKRSDETIMPFLTDNNTSITIKSGDNLEEIKFKGTLTFQKFLCGWGGYYFKVDKMDKGSIPVDDEIRVTVTYGGDAFDNYDYPLEIGDKAEIYAILTHDYKFHDNHIGHEVWGATIMYSKYYVKKLESEPSLSISVWTDKPKYKIGETVTIYYKTNKKCTAKLTVTKPDGEKIVYGPNEMPACTRSKSATAGYPTGTRTVVFEAWADGKSKKSTCYFNVADEKKPTPPPTPPPTLTPTPPPQNPVEKYALIIGIDKYEEVGRLYGSVNDANAIYNLLVNGYNYDRVLKLTNDEAKQKTIIDSLTDFDRDVDSNDIFVFYFSGHGRRSSGTEYISPYDSKKSDNSKELSDVFLKP